MNSTQTSSACDDGNGHIQPAGDAPERPIYVSCSVAQLPASLGTKTKAGSVSVAMASDSLMLPPGSHTAITPSDSTDVTAIASVGLLCTVAGTLAVRGLTTASTTVSFPCVAGQYVYGQLSRVMAATTGTYIGLAP